MISVLYVDDEPDLLDLGKLFLEQNGSFEVTTISSGNRALDLIKRQHFDALISDFQMPEMDGITLLRRVRMISDIPFILFTGRGREEVVIEAINNGADFYLQKGGEPSAQFAELGHKIIQAVSRRSAEQALHKRLSLIRQTAITSTLFIRMTPDQMVGEITRTLEKVARQCSADRSYIALLNQERTSVSIAYEWTAFGIEPVGQDLGSIPLSSIPWLSSRIDSLEVVNIPSVGSFPGSSDDRSLEQQRLATMGIKSILLIPLAIGTTFFGAIGLDSVRQEMNWKNEDIDILRIYGQIIVSALARKNAEHALRESEELYRTVFESTGTAMMILAEDKTVIAANREMEKISGYNRSEIEGKMPWTAFVSADDLARMETYHVMRREDPSSVPHNYDFVFLNRNGQKIQTNITVDMIPGTKKSVVSIMDVSGKKAAQQELADSEEKFRGLTESLPESIYMIQDNRFVYVNPAFCRLFGYSSADLLALADFSAIFSEGDRPRVMRAVTERLEGLRDTERYMARGARKDGTVISLAIHGSRTRYRGRPAIIGTITEMRN